MSRTAHVHVHVNAHIRSHGPSFQRHGAIHPTHHVGTARHLQGPSAGGAPPVGVAGPSAAPRFVPQQLQDGFDAGRLPAPPVERPSWMGTTRPRPGESAHPS